MKYRVPVIVSANGTLSRSQPSHGFYNLIRSTRHSEHCIGIPASK